MSAHAMPVGGPILTRASRVVLALAALGGLIILYRFLFGIGAVSALNDGYPWGVWIAFDVVTGTALACGGYAVALLVYVFNKGKYHPLVRSAILTSALGYSMAIVAVIIDIGRWWNMWKLPFYFWSWNLNSILLEVALCVAAYTTVLWIEMSPAFFERWKDSSNLRLRQFARRANPFVERSLIWIVAAGILLPTMHQSSLGGVMLLAGPRLHEMWSTPLLPLLFLVSCIGMGFAVVVFESLVANRSFGRPLETKLLAGIAGAIVWIQVALVILRVGDWTARGQLGAFAADGRGIVAAFELVLFILPILVLWNPATRVQPGTLLRGAMLLIAGGAMFRFDTYLIAFQPGAHWSYFPSLGELFSSIGLVAAEILVYLVIVKQFPVLTGAPAPAARVRPEEVAV